MSRRNKSFRGKRSNKRYGRKSKTKVKKYVNVPRGGYRM